MSDLKGNKDALIDALNTWWADAEGQPSDPSDAELMKALWHYHGDKTEPCDECDGECGEPCAPCSADAAIKSLDEWSDRWREKRGIKVVPSPDLSATPQ